MFESKPTRSRLHALIPCSTQTSFSIQLQATFLAQQHPTIPKKQPSPKEKLQSFDRQRSSENKNVCISYVSWRLGVLLPEQELPRHKNPLQLNSNSKCGQQPGKEMGGIYNLWRCYHLGSIKISVLEQNSNASFHGIIIDFEMQALQDLKEVNDQRFDSIDRRWGQVEDALRIEQKERQGDVHLLRERLQDRVSVADSLEKSKAKVLKETLDNSMKEANECKENLEDCFDYEAEFRMNHLDKKNAFIQAYNQSGEEFVGRIDEYQKEKVKEIASRLESIDIANHEVTNQTVRFIKEEKMAETRAYFDSQRSRFEEFILKTRADANREVDQLRLSLKQYGKKREESDAKLQIMIAALGSELSKLQEVEWKQGEITYDCLLKVVEDACAKIQEAQLK